MDRGNQPGNQERQPPEGQAKLPIPENRAKNETKTTATRQPKWLRTMDKGNQPGSQERQPPEGQAKLPIPENNQKGNEKGGQQGSQKSN